MNNLQIITTVLPKEAGERLDKFLVARKPEYSRNYYLSLIKRGNVTVNSSSSKGSYIVKSGDSICVQFTEPETDEKLQAEDIPLKIIFENDDAIVIDKQPNLVVHPGCGNTSGTLVNALLNHFPNINEATLDKSDKLQVFRPGIVHRLDKDTTGVMIVAKNIRALSSLSKQIKNRTVKKQYVGLCYGWPKNDAGILNNYIGRSSRNRKVMATVVENKGKQAITEYKVLDHYKFMDDKVSLIEFDIKTGRTHQIRLQSSIIGCPILGDESYGSKLSHRLSKILSVPRPLLHSHKLKISLPGNPKASEYVADIPNDMINILDKLSKQD